MILIRQKRDFHPGLRKQPLEIFIQVVHIPHHCLMAVTIPLNSVEFLLARVILYELVQGSPIGLGCVNVSKEPAIVFCLLVNLVKVRIPCEVQGSLELLQFLSQ